MIRTSLLAAGLLAASPWSPSSLRAQERQLTTTAQHHHHARISPDGDWVAFQAASAIFVIPFAGGTAQSIAPGSILSPFYYWHPASTELYYADGDIVRRVTRDGATNQTLATVPGLLRLWSVHPQGDWVYGVRRDVATQQNRIFRIDTSSGALQELLSELDPIEDVDIDPSGSWMVFRTSSLFATRYFRAPATGGSQVAFGPNPFTFLTEGGRWTGAGDRICFYSVDPANPQGLQIATMDFPAGTVTFLTGVVGAGEAQNPSPIAGGEWLLYERHEGGGGQRTVRLLPSTGGGDVVLSSVLNLPGPATASSDGLRVAYTGIATPLQTFSQVRVNEVLREVRCSPRAEVGGSFSCRVPATATETVLLWMSVRPGTTPIQVPPLTGVFLLDAQLFFFLGSSQGELAAPLAVPNDPLLADQDAYFQALRLSSLTPLAGGFTRRVVVRIF